MRKNLALTVLLASLSQGVPANAAPTSAEEALCAAAYKGTLAEVNAALAKTSSFGHVCKGWGATALKIAVLNSRSTVVAALLRAGATPRSTAPGTSPILFSAHDGETAKLLLAAGAPPDERNADGSTALCFLGSSRMLLTDPDVDGPKEVAAIAEALIAAKADINAVCDGGETPLISAAHGGNHIVAKVLLAHGADFTRRDAKNRTALTFADFYATGAGSVRTSSLDRDRPAHRKELAAALRAKGATR